MLDDYKKQLQNITKNAIIKNTTVKRLLDTAFMFYKERKYSISLYKYEQANAETSAYKNKIKSMQDIVLRTIIVTQKKLEAEKTYAEKVKLNADIAIFYQAAKNANPDFNSWQNFTDSDYLQFDSLSFEDFGLQQLNPYVEKAKI